MTKVPATAAARARVQGVGARRGEARENQICNINEDQLRLFTTVYYIASFPSSLECS